MFHLGFLEKKPNELKSKHQPFIYQESHTQMQRVSILINT
jgi:hypothetical protein